MLKALIVVSVVGFGAVMMNEGVFSAAVILVCVVAGGLIAFNFFEPVAHLLESNFTFLDGYGDIIAMLGLFAIAVTGLRLVSEQIAPTMVEFPDLVHRMGGFAIGGWIGWIFAGIMVCALQTLPLHRQFLGYRYDAGLRDNDDRGDNGAWNVDRRWLAYVQRVSQTIFDQNPARSFDPKADFVIRYYRYRRTGDDGTSMGSAASIEVPRNQSTLSGRRRRGG